MTEPTSHQTGTIRCPECSWTTEFEMKISSELAKKVDAEMHWQEFHGGKVPDSANFGDHQCPECYSMSGLDGTVSCSNCGHVPEKVRA